MAVGWVVPTTSVLLAYCPVGTTHPTSMLLPELVGAGKARDGCIPPGWLPVASYQSPELPEVGRRRLVGGLRGPDSSRLPRPRGGRLPALLSRSHAPRGNEKVSPSVRRSAGVPACIFRCRRGRLRYFWIGLSMGKSIRGNHFRQKRSSRREPVWSSSPEGRCPSGLRSQAAMSAITRLPCRSRVNMCQPSR